MGARGTTVTAAAVLLALLAVAGCSGASGASGGDDVAAATTATTADADSAPGSTTQDVPVTTATAGEPATAPTTTPAAEAAAPTTSAPTTTTTNPPRPRVVTEQAWTPFATVGGVTLVHPSSRVERVGFHESNHDGARQLEPLPTAVAPTTLETRERGTESRTAADVVVDPDVEIRAPVTGTVIRAGTYVLYCDYSDDYAVIEPDDHPGWEVKILHIDGVQVTAGQRVVAGETVVAPRPTILAFESQVDETTADPAWPHVHIEVVDPSIPDRPTPGGGCS